MPESNQIQTQSKLNSQIQVIAVPKRVYNVVKSIVDSSTKQTYEWNKPIVVDMKTVKFVKYKTLQNSIEVKAWEIVVQPMVIQKEETELNATLISVRDGTGMLVADLVIRTEFTAYEPRKSYTLTITSKPDNIEIDADSAHEFEFYAVKPSEETPYARPISLAALINKLMFYYSKALEVVRNVDANENEQL
jgi:hypothetical protein